MTGRGKKSNGILIAKSRCQRHIVKQVPGSHPGIVGDKNISRLHRFNRKTLEKMADGHRHRVHVSGRTRDGLSQHLTFKVVHTSRQITRFPHH